MRVRSKFRCRVRNYGTWVFTGVRFRVKVRGRVRVRVRVVLGLGLGLY